MAKRTQKAGASAKYGPRYGVSVRRRAASVLKKRSRRFTCPSCQYQKVSRTVAGIWECSKCGHKFTGGYWEPFTRATEANNRICLLYTSPSPRDRYISRMPSSA